MPSTHDFISLDVEDNGTIMTVRERLPSTAEKAVRSDGVYIFAIGVLVGLAQLGFRLPTAALSSVLPIVIGLIVIVVSARRKVSRSAFTLDRETGELCFGSHNIDGFTAKGTLRFDQIDEISISLKPVKRNQPKDAILFVEGEDAPKNPNLVTGALEDLEELRRRVTDALRKPVGQTSHPAPARNLL